VNIPASGLGKAKMGVESWAVGALILGPAYLGKFYFLANPIGLWLAIIMALTSAAEYYVRFGPQVLSKQP